MINGETGISDIAKPDKLLQAKDAEADFANSQISFFKFLRA